MVPTAQREQNLQPWKSWARKNLQQCVNDAIEAGGGGGGGDLIDYFDNIEEDDLIIDQLIKTIFKKCDKNIATRSYGG